MQFSFALLAISVCTAPIAKPGVVKDVTDQIFPTLTTIVHQASLLAVQDIKTSLVKDTDEFIALKLSKIPLLPKGAEDKIRRLLNDKIVNKVGNVIAKTVSVKVTPAVGRMLGAFQNELHIIDKDLEDYLTGLHNRIRSIGTLPPQ